MFDLNKKEKELQRRIKKALKHEENVQHDENEEPVTFAEESEK